jgi:lysophospholipase L1-like esterase
MTQGRSQRRLKVALLASSLALVLAGSELGLRAAFPHGLHGSFDGDGMWPWLRFDPVLGWRNRHGDDPERGLRFDGRGVRVDRSTGPPEGRARPPAAGAPDPLRVLCLGDSRTFGIWTDLGALRFDGDYASQLERLASLAGDRPIESWNAGTLGYTSAQGLRQWSTRFDDLQPDVVVAAFGFNDHSFTWNTRFRVRDPRSAIARRLLHAASGFRWAELIWWQVRRPPFSSARMDPGPWVTQADFRRNLERLAEDVARRGAVLVLLDLPLRPLDLGENQAAFPGQSGATDYTLFGARDLAHLHEVDGTYRRLLREAAAVVGVPVLDVEAAFAAHQVGHPAEAMFSPYDFAHPTDAGARVIAAALLVRLRELGVYD